MATDLSDSQIGNLQHELAIIVGEIDFLFSSLSNKNDCPRPQRGQQGYLPLVLRNLRDRLEGHSGAVRELEVELACIHDCPLRAGKYTGTNAALLVVRIAQDILTAVDLIIMSDERVQRLWKDAPRTLFEVDRTDSATFIQMLLYSQSEADVVEHLASDTMLYWWDWSNQLRSSPDFRDYYTRVLFPALRAQLLRQLDGFDSEQLKGEIELEFTKFKARLSRPDATTARMKELTRCEQDCISVVREAGRRLTTMKVLAELQRSGWIHGEGTVKKYLAQLCENGYLNNRRDFRGKGYGLPEWGKVNGYGIYHSMN